MAEKYLVVVDMQEDFITGALGSREAEGIVSRVAEKVKEFDGTVLFTLDTHTQDYLKTQEGRNLPVKHCIRGTGGWELVEPLRGLQKAGNLAVYEKNTFGCVALAQELKSRNEKQPIESIELIGVCTDICVVSNALLLKAFMPEVPVSVDAGCCAGVTEEKHRAALETMKCCQIDIKQTE